MDILDTPVIFIDQEDKHVDSDIYFEPYIQYFDPSYSITTRPVSALKKKIMTNTITGRSLGGLSAITYRGSPLPDNVPKMEVVVMRTIDESSNKMDLQLVTFGNQAEDIQHILLDYLVYIHHKKVQTKADREEAEKKMWARVEELTQKQKEKEKKKQQDTLSQFSNFLAPPSEQQQQQKQAASAADFSFLEEADKFGDMFPDITMDEITKSNNSSKIHSQSTTTETQDSIKQAELQIVDP
jgi:hypothetical protein